MFIDLPSAGLALVDFGLHCRSVIVKLQQVSNTFLHNTIMLHAVQ